MAQADIGSGLIEALLAGAFETPLWRGFLDMLRATTRADYATMIIRLPERPADDALYLLSGDAAPSAMLAMHRRNFFPEEPLAPRHALIEGQVYAFADLRAVADDREIGFYHHLVAEHGITAVRQMRVQEPSGVDAKICVVRRGDDFTDRDTATIAGLAPVLRGVLRHYVVLERERFAAAMASDTVRRLRFGWLALDARGVILDHDDEAAQVLATSSLLGRSNGHRLTARSTAVERDIYQALAQAANDPDCRPRAISLSREPWLDMLIVPARRNSISSKARPAVIAYIHGDSWHATDRCEQLTDLFGLAPREARMAVALSRGMTITEAAAEFNLSVGSARMYTKNAYSKTGARGLPDLVRIVMRSILAVAPEA